MTNFEIQRADCILRPVQSSDTEAQKRPSTRTMSKKINSIMSEAEARRIETEKLVNEPVSTRVDRANIEMQEQTERDITAALERQGKIPPARERIRASLQKSMDKSTFDVTTKFEGTAADLDLILKNTKLKGLGKNFLAAQEKYGVNALFMIAIAQKESTWGKFTPEKNPYNFAGLGIKNIKSFADCVDKLAKTLSGKNYLQAKPPKKTPSKIAPTYCPPKAAIWSTDVTTYMNNYRKRLLSEVYTA